MFPDFISSYTPHLLSLDDSVLCLNSEHPVDYPSAVSFMQSYAKDIREKNIPESIWFLEHPDIYTAGTSANPNDLLWNNKFPVYDSGRGGQYTYHGKNQLVVYVMLDLQKRHIGVKEFVKKIENLIITCLTDYGITAKIYDGRVGVWVDNDDETAVTASDKIAAIGIRISKGVSYHGFAVNLAPNLQNFEGIVPCGLSSYGVTSLEKLGKPTHRTLFQDKIKQKLALFF